MSRTREPLALGVRFVPGLAAGPDPGRDRVAAGGAAAPAWEPSPGSAPSLEAYFLPQGDPAAWLAEIARWGVRPDAVTLVPIGTVDPGGPADPTARVDPIGEQGIGPGDRGALVLLARGARPRAAPLAARLARWGTRCWGLPGGALAPPLAPAEIDALAPGALAVLFAPRVGSVVAAPAHALDLAALVAVEPAPEVAWDRAAALLAAEAALAEGSPQGDGRGDPTALGAGAGAGTGAGAGAGAAAGARPPGRPTRASAPSSAAASAGAPSAPTSGASGGGPATGVAPGAAAGDSAGGEAGPVGPGGDDVGLPSADEVLAALPDEGTSPSPGREGAGARALRGALGGARRGAARAAAGLLRGLLWLMGGAPPAGSAAHPPAPGAEGAEGAEPSPPPGRGAGDAAGRRLARARQEPPLAERPPGPVRGALDRLVRFALTRAGLLDALARGAGREAEDLLRLLDRDPDEGLRRAPPLGGRSGSRSDLPLASAAGLPPRRARPELEPADLAGPAPSGVVPLDGGVYERLRARYLALADRALELGQHRRAAYIHAVLLGDLARAALALRAGSHWREAAAIYRDRLGEPLAAALCLEEAGLAEAAARLYEQAGQSERAGDLLARLGRADDAARLWRVAVEVALARGEAIEAAQLLADKLGAPEEALACLAAYAPASAERGALALAERFRLYARLGRHPEAARVARGALAGDGGPAGPPSLAALPVGRALARVARSYPDEGVRRAAEVAVREAAGRGLAEVGRAAGEGRLLALELDGWSQALSEAAGGIDALVLDDLRRYRGALHARWGAARRARQRGGGARAPGLAVTAELALPKDIRWEAAISTGEVFYAAGIGRLGPVLVRGRFSGAIDEPVEWRLDEGRGSGAKGGSGSDGHRGAGGGAGGRGGVGSIAARAGARASLQLAAWPHFGHPVVLVGAGGAPYPLQKLRATRAIPLPKLAGTPPWLPRGTRAVAYGQGGLLYVLSIAEGDATLSVHGADGDLRGAHALAGPIDAAGEVSLDADPHAPRAVAAIGARLYFADERGALPCDLERPHAGLALGGGAAGGAGGLGGGGRASPRVAVAFEEGGLLLAWPAGADGADGAVEPVGAFAAGLPAPAARFNRALRLAALGDRELRIYDASGDRLLQRATLELALPRPFTVLATGRADEVAVLDRGGRLQVLREER